MGSQIKFTQLYGATCDAPLSSLLEINGFTFLIDCGWTEAFDVALLDPLKEAIPRIDAVLLSHPDTAHLGALPYAIGHLGLKVPIYATQPTCRMGQMFMYDQYLSHHANSEFEHFDLDDVDTAFDYQTVHQLKFQQNMKLTGQLPACLPGSSVRLRLLCSCYRPAVMAVLNDAGMTCGWCCSCHAVLCYATSCHAMLPISCPAIPCGARHSKGTQLGVWIM